MTKSQTTTNYRKSPQTTANHRKKTKPPHITANHHQNLGHSQWNQRRCSQTTTNHRKPPPEFGMVIRVLEKATILSKLWLIQSGQAMLVEHDAFANTDHSKFCIFTMFQFWFVVIWGGLPCRQTTTNHYRNAVNMQNLGRCVFMCRWIGCRACFVWCAMFHGDICTVSIITWGFFFFRYCAGQCFIAALSHTGGQARKN